MKIQNIGLVFAVLVMSGCAQYGDYRPTIDPYGDKNAYRLDQDIAECKMLAKESGGGALTQGAIGTGVGAIGGAGSGAAISAIAGGNAGLGAAIGGTVGALGGLGYKAYESEQRYRYAFNNCLSTRGHSIVR